MSKMKKLFLLLSFLLTFSIFLSTNAAEVGAYEYNDVKENSSHYEAINYLFEEGFIGGFRVDQNYLEFRPNTPIIRSEVAAIFASVLDLPLLEDNAPFIQSYKDLDMNHPLILSIASNIEQGIFKGEGDYFKDTVLNREQMATVLVRAFNLTSSENKNTVGNLLNVSESHKDAVALLFNHKLTTETNDFRPQEKVTRAQFITFLYRTMKLQGLQSFTISDNRDRIFKSLISYGGGASFHESIYFSKDKSLFLTNELYVRGAEYAIAYPNSFILFNNEEEFIYLPKEGSVTLSHRKNVPIYSLRLFSKKYKKPSDVPLPNGTTYEQLEIDQKSKHAELKEKNNLRHHTYYSPFTTLDLEGTITRRAHNIGPTRNHRIPMDPKELVLIINWTVETGEVYDGDYFAIYYDFKNGIINIPMREVTFD